MYILRAAFRNLGYMALKPRSYNILLVTKHNIPRSLYILSKDLLLMKVHFNKVSPPYPAPCFLSKYKCAISDTFFHYKESALLRQISTMLTY